jgi:hypothetical protein
MPDSDFRDLVLQPGLLRIKRAAPPGVNFQLLGRPVPLYNSVVD